MASHFIKYIQAAIFFASGCMPVSALENEIGLYDAENIAIANSFELKAMRGEMKIINETTKGKFRDFFPAASLSYRTGRSITERELDTGNHSVQLSITQPVYDSGRRKLAYDLSRISLRIAKEKYRTEENALRFQIRKSFMEIQHKREVLSITEANLQNAESLLIKSEKEKKLGLITELDYLEIKNEFHRRSLTLKQSKDELDDALEEFYFTLNAGADYRPSLKNVNLHNIHFSDQSLSPEKLLENADKKRMDLKEARLSILRAKNEYIIEKHSSFPVISLTGHYGKSGEKWPPVNPEWGLGINISFSIAGNSLSGDTSYTNSQNGISEGYSGGSNLSILDNPVHRRSEMEKELALKRSRKNKEDLEHSIKTSIPVLCRNLKNRKASLELSEEITFIQEKRHEIEKIKFNLGEISLHDYYREELKLHENRLQLIREKVDLILNINQLELEAGLELDSLNLFKLNEYSSLKSSKGAAVQNPG